MTHSASHADLNLLFGVLALQVNFVTRDGLLKGMNAWALEKHRPLGQILVEQEALRQDLHDVVEVMVRKHLEIHDNDPHRSLAAVRPDGRARDDLGEIADLDVQASVGRLGPAADEVDPWQTVAPPAPASPPSTRYRRLRPHARGGLGEVFVALDEELQREVALKEIQPQHADHTDTRARFLVEAEVTGKLEHPGVVPVYGLGSYEDGRPFYAMRFIKGDSLKDVIERFHRDGPAGAGQRAVDLRALLGRFLDVCDAVAYAHSRGVLHRDLKPGNVMLGRYGETLVVDWGLAKLMGRSDREGEETPVTALSAGDAAPTQAGAVVGTPAFMSPEQAAGRLDLLGPASDVYSLGATLYCILTGQPPFLPSAEDGPGALLVRVQQGDFPPPRQVKPEVSRPLEAICLKAMAHRPERRYSSVGELAQDLQLWLAGEPVKAWPEPAWAPAVRWVKRNRAMAASLLAALVVTGAAGAGVYYQERQREQTRLDKAAGRDRQAERLVGEIAVLRAEARHAGPALARSGWNQALAKAEEAHALLAEGGMSEELRQRVDRLRDALRKEERSRAMVSRLEEARLRGLNWDERGFSARLLTQEYSRAFAAYFGVQDVRKVAEDDFVWDIAGTGIVPEVVAALDHWATNAEGAEERRWALRLAERLTRDPVRGEIYRAIEQKDRKALQELARSERLAKRPALTRVFFGMALVKLGALDEAEAVFQRIHGSPADQLFAYHGLWMCAVRRRPCRTADAERFLTAVVALRPLSPHAHTLLAVALATGGKYREAEESLLRAIELKPDDVVYEGLATIRLMQGKYKEAERAWRQALALAPRNAQALYHLGKYLTSRGRHKEAEQACRSAIEIAPTLSSPHEMLATALAGQGRYKEAEQACRLAIQLAPQSVEAHATLGTVLAAQRKHKEAEQVCRLPIGLDPQDANGHQSLGFVLLHQGKAREAEQAYREAVRLDPQSVKAYRELGSSLSQQGKFREAEEACHHAARLDPDSAANHGNLGEILSAQHRHQEAEAAYQRALQLSPDAAPVHAALGLAQLHQGKFPEALSSFRRCADLVGPEQRGLRQAAQQLILHTERQLALDRRFADVLAGKTQPRGGDEGVELAAFALEFKKCYATAMSLYAGSFRTSPQLAAAHRYNAACAAARAGTGQGKDAATLDESARAEVRYCALGWLHDDLALHARQLSSLWPGTAAQSRQTLQHWQKDPDLAAVRDRAALRKLPEAEEVAWLGLWAQVDALLARTRPGK